MIPPLSHRTSPSSRCPTFISRSSDLHVLKGVNLTANKGDVGDHDRLLRVGESQRLLRCVNLLEVPEKGSIAISGEDITFKPKGNDRLPSNAAQVNRVRANLSMVFQQFNSVGSLCRSSTTLCCPSAGCSSAPSRKPVSAPTDTLRRVGIDDKADAFPCAALGRSAAARRHCACAGDGPRSTAVRRAHFGAGPRARRRSAAGDQVPGRRRPDHVAW